MDGIRMYQRCSINCVRNYEILLEEHNFITLSMSIEKHQAFVNNGEDEVVIERICPECGEMCTYHFRIIDYD